MPKKIRVRKSNPDPELLPDKHGQCVLSNGHEVTVGDTLLVKHHSSGGRWQEAVLKRITRSGEEFVFHFYLSPPGTISVLENRIQVPKKKKIRIKK